MQMEIFLENTALIASLVALIVIGFMFFILTGQKRQAMHANWNRFENPGQNELGKVDPIYESENKIKSKAEEILEQFDELELIQKIYKLLVLEKIYLQQGLTVGDFAKKLGVQARIVTQIFSELYGHTFKELINMYRVEYAKEKIEEGFLDHFTMEALGQKAGFSSRTTFFNVFKKEIGVCPSEYWKNYLTQAA